MSEPTNRPAEINFDLAIRAERKRHLDEIASLKRDLNEARKHATDIEYRLASQLDAASTLLAAANEMEDSPGAYAVLKISRDSLKADLAAARDDEDRLRALLFDAHGCSGKYGDDGEMQCNANPPIDFKRSSVEWIETNIPLHGFARLLYTQQLEKELAELRPELDNLRRELNAPCTCGSGLHPRHCQKHPQGFDLHVLTLNYEAAQEQIGELDADLATANKRFNEHAEQTDVAVTALKALEAEISSRFAKGDAGLKDMSEQLRTAVLQARTVIKQITDDPEEDPLEPPDYGPCCACGKEQDGTVRNILMLYEKAPVPGTGWACFICSLPADGACAIVCDACQSNAAKLKWACAGYMHEKGRIPIAELTGKHEHNLRFHPEMAQLN